MRSPTGVTASTVELRRNTSKPSFEALRSTEKVGTSPSPIPVLSQRGSLGLAGSMGQAGTVWDTLGHPSDRED